MAGNMLLLQNTYDVLYRRAETRNAPKYQAWLLANTLILNLCYLGPQHHTQQLQTGNKNLLTSLSQIENKLMQLREVWRGKENGPSGKQCDTSTKSPIKNKGMN